MSLCEANEKLLKGFDKKPDLDDYMRNIKPIFQEIMEKEPEETREQKVKNMLYDVKAAEYKPTGELFTPLVYTLLVAGGTIWATKGSDFQQMIVGLIFIVASMILAILAPWYMKKQDYRRKIIMLFLEEQLLEMREKK